MKKKLLPAMAGVALAFGMTPAVSDVTLFGHIDTSVDAVDIDGGYDDINMNCTTCSVGFKGSEDLGNGLKAIFKLDFQYDTTVRNDGDGSGADGDNDNSGLLDRDQWLGLAGGFGQVRIGTISTGYKSHGALVDPLYRTALQGRDRGLQSPLNSGAGEELHGRATNTIRWDSVDYEGVRLVAHYTLDSDESDGEDENPYGVGASYKSGGLLVFGDYMNNDQDTAAMTAGWKVGGRYDMGMFSVMGQFEDFDDSSSFNDDVYLWHLGGTMSMLGVRAYLGFGQGTNDDTNHDYTAWTLAAMHDFSKRTMIYAGFNEIDCDAGAGMTLSACSDVGPAGGEDDKFSLGLKHKF